MRLTKRFSWQFMSPESGLTGLLFFSLAHLFVVSALGDLSFGAFVGHILFSLIILTGVLTTFRQHWLRFLGIVLAVAGLTLTWIAHIHRSWSLIILSAILIMLFLVFLLAILIIQVFQAGPVTAHRIRGAVVVYLLMGGIWSFFYYVVALTDPQAFNWPQGLDTTDLQAVRQVLTYFSFTTLTTTGFGDITPAIPLTRTLAIFESLAGQLYLVVTLTRLVSLSVVSPNTPHKPDRSHRQGPA
jgi:hypothetical protein